MQGLIRQTGTGYWLDHKYTAQAARSGGGVRRSFAWVDREVGRTRFLQEVRLRGYHLIETADQLTVGCHNGPIRILF